MFLLQNISPGFDNMVHFSEFHYFLPIEQLRVVAEGITPDMALTFNQGTVEQKTVDYASLFFNGCNPALKQLGEDKSRYCVLRISPAVAQLSGVVISDRKAFDSQARIFPVSESHKRLDFTILYRENGWLKKEASLRENRRRVQMRNAQLLVPGGVHSRYIRGIFVVSEKTKRAVQDFFPAKCPAPISVHPKFFFEKAEHVPSFAEEQSLREGGKSSREDAGSLLPAEHGQQKRFRLTAEFLEEGLMGDDRQGE